MSFNASVDTHVHASQLLRPHVCMGLEQRRRVFRVGLDLSLFRAKKSYIHGRNCGHEQVPGVPPTGFLNLPFTLHGFGVWGTNTCTLHFR